MKKLTDRSDEMRQTSERSDISALELPAFLRRRRGKKTTKKSAPAPTAGEVSAKRPDREGEELNASLAQYGLRVAGLDDFDAEAGFQTRDGVLPRRWARESGTVMEIARQVAARKEAYERNDAGRAERVEAARAERAALKAKKYEGMIRLDALLAEVGAGAPSLGRAKKAIERAHMIHRKFHFGPKEVEQARQVLRALPAAGPRPGAGAGASQVRQTAPAPVGILRMLVKSNPHKDGTEQHRRMATLMNFSGKLASEFLAAGGCRLKLKHAISQGWVALGEPQEDPTEKTAAAPRIKKAEVAGKSAKVKTRAKRK
jgi:hypothetical protein